MICVGTCFQLCEVNREGPGQASSSTCLEALKCKWMTWAGHPEARHRDRGLHNRGVLAEGMSSHGVQVHHTIGDPRGHWTR